MRIINIYSRTVYIKTLEIKKYRPLSNFQTCRNAIMKPKTSNQKVIKLKRLKENYCKFFLVNGRYNNQNRSQITLKERSK